MASPTVLTILRRGRIKTLKFRVSPQRGRVFWGTRPTLFYGLSERSRGVLGKETRPFKRDPPRRTLNSPPNQEKRLGYTRVIADTKRKMIEG